MNQQKFPKQWNDFEKIEKEMATKKRKMMEETMKVIVEKDEKIGVLVKENLALKMKMARFVADSKQNLSIRTKLPLPIELLSELFGSLALENAYGILVKMPNALMARNIQKMLNCIKEEMKKNKLNEHDCGSRLTISEGGLAAKHSGPNEFSSVRTVLPIPVFNLNGIINKPTISFYFEVQIPSQNIVEKDGIVVGFCNQQFPLNESFWYNSTAVVGMGIWCKDRIVIGGSRIEFENGRTEEYFKKGDMVGIGLVHQPNSTLECFATLNDELLGKAVLPEQYANIPLFPAISLFYDVDSIRTNFGKDKWIFKDFERVLK